jgi:ribosomal protein S18 acetylase RimI-like enzyme
MRIRHFRQKDIPDLVHIYQAAASVDGTEMKNDAEIEEWLTDPELDAISNAFIVSDDDDELNTWGQAETLDGIEGEVVGFTVVTLRQDQHGYHFLCQGAVHPQYRRQHAGRLLLVGALNRTRLVASEFDFEAEQEGIPIYFEALLPAHDPLSASMAAKLEMQPTDEPAPAGLRLYRREL